MRMMIWIRLALGLMLLMMAAGRATAANSGPVMPHSVCALASDQRLDTMHALHIAAKLPCTDAPTHLKRRFSYAVITGLALDVKPHDPWQLRHEYSQALSETLYARYADGMIIQASATRKSARRLFSAGKVAFDLPTRPGRIESVMIAIEGLQNQRGVAPGLEFITAQGAFESDLVSLLLYGLLGGAVLALLIYNAALYIALRYAFILSYCFSACMMIFMGVCWSGGIFLLLPQLDTTDQISLTMLGTSLVVGSSALFMINFIGYAATARWPRRLTILAALIGTASSLMRLYDVTFAWATMDLISYWSMFAVLIGVLVTAGVAWRRGSRAAGIYLMAWTVPIILAAARVVWAMGIIGGASTIVATSPLIIMAAEALMSSLAVTWRIALLRSERDEARAQHHELRYQAETDPLTSLLNRRAFINRAIQPTVTPGQKRLILMDIDKFKQVNDNYGHQCGDDVLIAVADILTKTAPPTALIGRLGGEEFAILVPARLVDPLADRLRRAVATAPMPAGIALTISAGVADGLVSSDAEWRQVYHAADQALYRAKHGGRNRVSHAPRAVAA
jgi:diguanylate cyclase (GGDEF)-like protein